MLSSPGEFKLKQVGFTLALEYLRNVGIRACKPDSHVRRMLGPERLGYFSEIPSPEEAAQLMMKLAHSSGANPTYLDNLMWIFCARKYGEICREANPKCGRCGFLDVCNYRLKNECAGKLLKFADE